MLVGEAHAGQCDKCKGRREPVMLSGQREVSKAGKISPELSLERRKHARQVGDRVPSRGLKCWGVSIYTENCMKSAWLGRQE